MTELREFYQYELIPPPEYLETTRVLTLAPGSRTDPLIGTLTKMSTTDPVPFEALSYVWGRHPSWDAIAVNGKLVKLTTSLGVMLRRLRYPYQSRVIWADQICINQKDLVERGQQVRHMNSIYQKASRVLVWLGDDTTGHAQKAFDLIRSLTAISQDALLLKQFKEKQADFDWFPDEYWASLSELFKQPWFDRKWILQEIGTDTPAELFWGPYSLGWDYVAKAAVLLKDHGYLLRRKYDLLVWKPWYMDKLFSLNSYKSKVLSFTYELHRARWQLASDPRDHIFALLGHPSVKESLNGERQIEADYMKSVEQVYHEVAVHLLRQGDSLMMLNVIQHETIESAIQRYNLPTWVAQWDSQKSLYNLLGDDTCVYRPSRDIRPEPQFLEAAQLLLLDGVTVDTISTTSKVLHTSDLTLSSPTIAELWMCQPECENEAFSTAKTYHGGDPAIFAFLETVSAIKKRKKQTPIPLSERLSDGTSFLVRAYDASHNIGEDLREMSQIGDCHKWMERASGGANGRRIVRGEGGYYALCPPAAKVGDKLCLLLGGQTIFCLRPNGDHYLFVGECYVHGVMDGELIHLLESGRVIRQTFKIR